MLSVWGLVATRLGTPDPKILYERLLPYADKLITVGMGMSAWGCHHVVRAELAQRLGDHRTGLADRRRGS